MISDVAAIDLEPRTYGLSVNYGAITQLSSPSATNCKGSSVSVSKYTYGTTNQFIVDVSPTGGICAGRWNRNTGNNIPDFTTCNPPTADILAGIANGTIADPQYVTASGGGANSNPVPIYFHPIVTSVAFCTATSSCPSSNAYLGTECISQNQTAQLEVNAFAGTQNITNQIGHVTYAAQTAGIVNIDQNGIATAQSPGATAISATVSQASSTVGYFYTCPPASILLNQAGTGATDITINPNKASQLAATVVDTKGNPITNIALTYTSTNPIDISVGGTGAVTATFPSNASIVARCEPATCNPAPLNQIGILGAGKPIVSNPVQVASPGRSSTILYMSGLGSQYFSTIDFTGKNVSSPVKLPFAANSMVADQNVNNLYFGSDVELMTVSTANNTVSKEDTNVQGIVLAASPDNSTLLINDQKRKLFYIYTVASGSFLVFGGVGHRAAFAPDNQTLYITGDNTLYIYSTFTGFHQYDVPTGSTDLAVTVPNIGVFVAGENTTARSFCAIGQTQAGLVYYPPAADVTVATDRIAASTDSKHIIGASAATGQLTDIDVTLPGANASGTACPANTAPPLQFPTSPSQIAFTDANLGSIYQVVTSPDSTVAFVNYTAGTGTTPANVYLPAYQVPAEGAGTIVNIPLTGTPTAPVGGVFSPDNKTFYTGTSGDNLVHLIDVLSLTDTRQIDPKLTDINGNPLPATFLAAKPRSTT